MSLTQTYEATRDLLTGIAYHRGSTLVAQRTYSYDTLGRPTARNTSRQGSVVNDAFTHNNRSELVAATVNGTNYEYAYDNIGNRTAATEGDEVTGYVSNGLNQYTMIRRSAEDFFFRNLMKTATNSTSRQKREIGRSTTMQQIARRTSPAWMKRGISSP